MCHPEASWVPRVKIQTRNGSGLRSEARLSEGEESDLGTDTKTHSTDDRHLITNRIDLCRGAEPMDGFHTFDAGNGAASRRARGQLPGQINFRLVCIARRAVLDHFVQSFAAPPSLDLSGCDHHFVRLGAADR